MTSSSSSPPQDPPPPPQEEPKDPNKEPEEQQQEKKKETDEEGLNPEYNVILYGTGLVQSIVASALARAGQSVLHCDANDYYGSLDAVWTLPYLCDELNTTQASTNYASPLANETLHDSTTFLKLSSMDQPTGFQLHSKKSVLDQPGEESSAVVGSQGSIVWTSKYGPARVEQLTTTQNNCVQLELSLLHCSLPDRADAYAKLCLTLPFQVLQLTKEQISEMTPEQLQQAVNQYYSNNNPPNGFFRLSSWQTRVNQDILHARARSFALDVSPGLLLAWGPAVQGLLQSSVADYVEFKSLEQVLYGYQMQPVPCSKNDVFSSSLLSPMEKRRLMKFLQLALDYGLLLNESTSSTDENAPDPTNSEKNDNDEPPGPGIPSGDNEAVTSWNERHLNQGRSLARPQNKAVSTDDLSVLQTCLDDKDTQWDLETYLSQKQRLSPSLVSLVRYALALEPIYQPDDSKSNNSNNENNNSQLKSGMQRLCRHMQALGRFGNTAFLVPLYGSGELSQAFCRSAAVYGATYLLRRSLAGIQIHTEHEQTSVTGAWLLPYQEENDKNGSEASKSNKRVACQHVIVPEEALASSCSLVSKRRVLRRISILCGKPMVSTPEQQQRVGIVIPPTKEKHEYTIHGLVLDESVNVAPHLSVKEPREGCSVVHLSTVVNVGESDNEKVDDTVLKEALDTILSQCKNKNDSCQEIFHASFSFPLFEPDKDRYASLPQGLHVVHRPAPDFLLDTAFEQAKHIFDQICPNKEFLVLAQEIDDMVKERFGDRRDEDDDEKRVLESAMDMIEPKESPKEQGEEQEQNVEETTDTKQ